MSAEGRECLRGCHFEDAHPGGFDDVQEVLRPTERAMGTTYGGPLLVLRKQPLRQILCFALVQRSCGHQCLRATPNMRKLLDKLSLQFNRKIVENATGAKGVGNYANSLVGACLVVADGVLRYKPFL